MANFYKYTEPLEVLNSEDLSNFFVNFNTIRTQMVVKGLSVSSFKFPMSGGKNTQLLRVKEILNNIEYNLDVLNDAVPSVYYVKQKRYEDIAPNKDDVWRWVQVTNDIYHKLFGDDAKVVFVTAGQQGATDEELEDLLFDT